MSFRAEKGHSISVNSEGRSKFVSVLKHHIMKSYEGVENEKVGPNFPCHFISLLQFYEYKQNYSKSFCLKIITILSTSKHCLAYARKNYWNIFPL
jgi:hypothetical protein